MEALSNKFCGVLEEKNFKKKQVLDMKIAWKESLHAWNQILVHAVLEQRVEEWKSNVPKLASNGWQDRDRMMQAYRIC